MAQQGVSNNLGFFRSLTIQTRILAAVWTVMTAISILFSFLLYDTQKSEYMEGIDKKLITGATMARSFVGTEFHDRVVAKDSVTMEDYLSIVDGYNKICLETGFQYLWSNLFLDDGTVIFTSGTSTSKDVTNGDHALFFDVHSDPAAFAPVMESGTTTFSTFHNEWGSGRMVLMPHQDSHGRTYVFGASISIDEFAENIRNTAFRAAIIFVVMLIIGSLVSAYIARAIAKPVRKLDQTAQDIAAGKYGHKVDDISGGAELVSLAETVNVMSDEILKNYEDLGSTVRELEETQGELQQSRDQLERRVAERTRDVRNLTQAVEQSPHMVLITDLDGNIEYVNQRFTEMTGYTSEEAIGQNPRILQSGDTTDEFYVSLWDKLLETGRWSGEIKDKRKNGQVFWASMTVSQVKDDHGKPVHYVAVHEDITERKMADTRIRIAKEQAELASRAKTEMLANMSHELRTPLNAIIGFSEAIRQETFGPIANERYQDYINDINQSGAHLLELINDVLDVSAIEAGKMELKEEPTTIDQIIEPCLRLIAPRAEAGDLKIHVDMGGEGFPKLRVDERRMKQALLNLLSNAVKFTPDGGEVFVTAEHRADQDVRIVVRDTGIGMDEQELAQAMEQFRQVDSGLARKFDGTGLGITLAKGLVESHGGELMIESRKHYGTTATITLPTDRVIL